VQNVDDTLARRIGLQEVLQGDCRFSEEVLPALAFRVSRARWMAPMLAGATLP